MPAPAYPLHPNLKHSETHVLPSLPKSTWSEADGLRPSVTDLMSPKKREKRQRSPPSNTPPTDPATETVFLGRDGLGAYIADPASFHSSRVVYHTENFVVINDLFPKSSIHLLLLPRNPSRQLLHPFNAFDGSDAEFLASVKEETRKLRILAAKELKRRFGKYSKTQQARDEAMQEPITSWPEGRDWDKEIISGIHAGPSMNHLHVHVMSREMHSECMRHRKHYNSFQTPFLIDVEEFPLEEGDDRRHSGREGYLNRDLVCWRCGKGFGNKFARLKEHLDEEFEAWKAE